MTVAAVAGRYDPDLAASRGKLIAAGKPRTVARLAVARKLLVRLDTEA